MSELINNREQKQKTLKSIIMELHGGKTVDEVKERFSQLIDGVSPEEVAAMEQSLIEEGLPVAEVQRLCSVHAAVFKGSLADYHKGATLPQVPTGHPIDIFRQENQALQKLIEEKINPAIRAAKDTLDEKEQWDLISSFKELWEIDKHYSRKENLLFPYLEKYGITAPPKVMWGVDDEIRDRIKRIKDPGSGLVIEELIAIAEEAVHEINEMIYKEENILFPMAFDTLTADEWNNILQESDDIGYCLCAPVAETRPDRPSPADQGAAISADTVHLSTGSLSLKELEAIFNHLPIDITFVDAEDQVRYFSHGPERIFQRTKAVIGRQVENCHPPGSVHVVEQIVSDFKSGAKDSEAFWLRMGDKYVHIRYFAIRDEKGEYMGTMEITQNIAPLQAITGEKRLLSD